MASRGIANSATRYSHRKTRSVVSEREDHINISRSNNLDIDDSTGKSTPNQTLPPNVTSKSSRLGGSKRRPVHVRSDQEESNEQNTPSKIVKNVEEQNFDSDSEKVTTGTIQKTSNQEWFPKNWEKLLQNIRQMRKDNEAPVDVMGCDKCHDETSPPQIQRYQILISLMLSSQTKDQVTFAAMNRLRQHGLTPANVLETDDRLLEDLIKPVGFYKKKTEYIKRASLIITDQYDGDIPDSVDKLCKLPGVGPKMAHLCMRTAWNVVSGIGVDTHVHRISQRIGWLPPNIVKKKNLTPEDTRKALESWLPQHLWAEVNHLLVGFGQTICKPVSPSCKDCLNYSICPSAKLKW